MKRMHRVEGIAALALLLLSVAAQTAARRIPGFATAYSHSIYAALSRGVSAVTGMVPVSLAELLLYGGLAALAIFLGCALAGAFHSRSMVPLFRYALHVFLAGTVLFFLYTFQCGINYYRTSFSQEAGIRTENYSEEDLQELCTWLVKEIQVQYETLSSEGTLSADETPVLGQTEETPLPTSGYLYAAGRTGQQAMEALGQRFPGLAGTYPMPKALLVSRLLSVQQVTGVYSPFTIEANYNREMPYYDIPFTICHELSHLKGYMQEEEANFIAFLATIGAQDPYFRYSGYVSGWVYAGNALASADPEAFSALYQQLPEAVRQDLHYNNVFWARFEGRAAETQEAVNDRYLKWNGQSSGVRSYGRVVDLMLASYASGLLDVQPSSVSP